MDDKSPSDDATRRAAAREILHVVSAKLGVAANVLGSEEVLIQTEFFLGGVTVRGEELRHAERTLRLMSRGRGEKRVLPGNVSRFLSGQLRATRPGEPELILALNRVSTSPKA